MKPNIGPNIPEYPILGQQTQYCLQDIPLIKAIRNNESIDITLWVQIQAEPILRAAAD